jgi:hypothetical protein
MLELAVLHKDALEKVWLREIIKPENMFFNGGNYLNYSIEIKDNSWEKLQYVSVDNEIIQGYMACDIDRTSNIITNVSFIRFIFGFTFSTDLDRFLRDLFEVYKFDKITFWVVVGNPFYKVHERIAKQFGGREVGRFLRHLKLTDGNIYDQVFYEIHREDYERSVGNEQ